MGYIIIIIICNHISTNMAHLNTDYNYVYKEYTQDDT